MALLSKYSSPPCLPRLSWSTPKLAISDLTIMLTKAKSKNGELNIIDFPRIYGSTMYVQQTTSRFSHYIWFSFFTFSMLLTTFLAAQGNAHSWPLQWAFGIKYWCSSAFRLLGGSCHEIFASLMVSSLCSLPVSSVHVTNIVTKQSLESLVIERKSHPRSMYLC